MHLIIIINRYNMDNRAVPNFLMVLIFKTDLLN